MKLIFRMKRKMICLMIAQKTMASQIIRVILIEHPEKDYVLRNLKNQRKTKQWTKCLMLKCYRKAAIRSTRILLIYLVSTLQMKSDHLIMRMLNVGWSLKYKKLFSSPIQPSPSDQFKIGLFYNTTKTTIERWLSCLSSFGPTIRG